MKNYETTRDPETGRAEGIPPHAFVAPTGTSALCDDCGHPAGEWFHDPVEIEKAKTADTAPASPKQE